jgi:hypothetical protein
MRSILAKLQLSNRTELAAGPVADLALDLSHGYFLVLPSLRELYRHATPTALVRWPRRHGPM